jgi:hypothetical protein
MIITYSWLDAYQSLGINTNLSYFGAIATSRKILRLTADINQSLLLDSAIDLEAS